MPENTDGIQGRRFGVEIEFNNLCVQGAHELLQSHGITAQRGGPYEFGVEAPWRVVPECSTEAGAELNTPVLDSGDPASYDLIRQVMAILVEDGRATLGRNVGVHVHVYAGDLSAASILDVVRWSGHYHQAWAELVGSYRGRRFLEQARDEQRAYNPSTVRITADNLVRSGYPGHEDIRSFASANVLRDNRPVPSHDPRRESGSVHHAFSSGTFWQVSMGKFPRNGTLEFRAHHSTFSAERICNWVHLLVGFVEYCHANPGNDPDDDGSTAEMLRRFVDPQTAQWLINYPQPIHAVGDPESRPFEVVEERGCDEPDCGHPECDESYEEDDEDPSEFEAYDREPF